MQKKKLFFVFLIIFVIVGSSFIFKNKKEIYINSILKTKDYAYLPIEAKEYIKETYLKTGEVVLTEKNKDDNEIYLNPQYVDYLTYSDEEKDTLGEIPVSMIVDYSTKDVDKTETVPSSYDLRNVDSYNYVTPVRDQGNLGLCWAFSTAGVAESHLLKINNTSYNSTSKLISERQIDYITATDSIYDYKSEYVSFVNRTLGDGGNFYISTIALANGVSFTDYNSFKSYDDTDLSKMELSDVISYSKSLYEVNSTINFPRLSLRESTSTLDEDQKETRKSYLNKVKQSIIENGAAYVGTYMDSSCIYKDSNLNNIVIDVYNCNVSGGHAMEIIGWNDDLEYSYCADTTSHKSSTTRCSKIVSGKGVWILKNSWGASIQYPYLTYDSLYTSIHFIDEVQSRENKNWDNNYILDSSEDYLYSKTYTLSDTKIRNDEKIKKIKFIAATSNTTYNVKITKKDGTYEVFQKTTNLPGLITIDITKDIIVNKDTEITVYSDNKFIDKVSIFTSNVDTSAFIDLSKYDNMTLSYNKIRLYSETKNIASGSTITYNVYDSNNNDVSNKVTFTNNKVAENNINTTANFSTDLDEGKYRIDALYNSNVIKSININITKMTGLGTESSPYIITNSIHLYQIRNDLDAYYELGNDIDLTDDTKEGGALSLSSDTCSQGFGWEAINGFSGSLDGKGHTIKGLYQKNYITCNDGQNMWIEWTNNGNGLFGQIKGNVTIKNIVLEDFDINCQGGYCGVLASKYIANMNDQGSENFDDENEYSATFKNIAVKNTKVTGVYNSYNSDSSLKNSNGGGLFGIVQSNYGNIDISNIYLDIDMVSNGLTSNALLASSLQGNNLNIKNIQLTGNLTGKYLDGSGDAILVYEFTGNTSNDIKNVLSTMTSTNVMSSLMGNVWNDYLTIDGVNILSIEDKPICKNNSCSSITNVNTYNKDTQLVELTKKSNYSSWEDFDSNWTIQSVDGVPRIPVLKFMDFEYTSIPDITIKQTLNKEYSIFDYITPKIDSAKRISYKSNDEKIVKINEDGTIIPQSSGNTTIHVESLYDGYIKDVPISITYVPHYNISFDANGGVGEMESIEVKTSTNYTLPVNTFTKENYEFNGWNTKADGTGKSYSNLGTINLTNDKASITLYAQWIGEERIVTFDANGGSVTPASKTVRYGGTYGELPIPTKSGYAFSGWSYIIDSTNYKVDSTSTINSYNLIANWKSNAYTIVYDANGGSLKNDYSISSVMNVMSNSKVVGYVLNGTDETLLEQIYEKNGYEFKEWNSKADGTGISYTENQIINLSNVDNDCLILYAIWEKVFDYEINNYEVDETNSYISKIMVNTEKDIFTSYFNLNSGFGIDVDYKVINSKKLIYTGGKTRITKNSNLYREYTNIVIGDINGDGSINSADLLRIRQHLLGSTSLSGAYFLSSDINYDDAINSADLLRIRQHLLGTRTIS